MAFLTSVLLLVALLSAHAHRASLKNLNLISEWKDIEFSFPSPSHRQEAIENGHYMPGRSLPIDVDIHYGVEGQARIFVTIPRFQTGIPVTVGIVTSTGSNHQSQLNAREQKAYF